MESAFDDSPRSRKKLKSNHSFSGWLKAMVCEWLIAKLFCTTHSKSSRAIVLGRFWINDCLMILLSNQVYAHRLSANTRTSSENQFENSNLFEEFHCSFKCFPIIEKQVIRQNIQYTVSPINLNKNWKSSRKNYWLIHNLWIMKY